MDPTRVEMLTDLLVALLRHDRDISAKAQALQPHIRSGAFLQNENDLRAVAQFNDVIGAALAEAEVIADDTALLWLLERLRLPEQ